MAESHERTRAVPDLTLDSPPHWTIQAAADGTWQVSAQLAADDQAALAALSPTAADLCHTPSTRSVWPGWAR